MTRVAIEMHIFVAGLALSFLVTNEAKAASELEQLLSNEEARKSYDECVGLYQVADMRAFEQKEKDKLNKCLATFGEYLLKYPNYLASQPRPDQLMERYDLFYKDGLVNG
jgi:hypothetical protein